MSELLGVLLAYPTVVFTAALALCLVYWLFVIVGALDVDLFGGEDAALDAASGEADGLLDALDADAEGALDGMAGKADGALDGMAGKADGALEGVEGVDGAAEGTANLLHAFSLRRAPVTVTFSLIALFGFIFSYLAVTYLGPLLTSLLPAVAAESLIFLGSLVLALPLTSWTTKPLEPIFRHRGGARRKDFVGTVCRVRTGRLSADRFGQATVEDGGAGLVIPVRIDVGELKRGDRALIVDYDAEREAYIVEAYDDLVGEAPSRDSIRR